MRIITRTADLLLGKLAPKIRAEAACTGEPESWCEGGVLWLYTPCPQPRTTRIGTC